MSTVVTSASGRTQLIVENKRFVEFYRCLSCITSIFKERVDIEGYKWSTITKEIKYFYWEEFKKYLSRDTEIEGSIKATWEVLAKSMYTDNLNKWRKHGRPVHVTESIWSRWNEAWGTVEFRARSERMSLNRRTEKARPGT